MTTTGSPLTNGHVVRVLIEEALNNPNVTINYSVKHDKQHSRTDGFIDVQGHELVIRWETAVQ